MTEGWIVLGLGCALGTAIADVLTKQTAAHRSHHEAMLIRTVLPVLLLLPLLPWVGWPRLEPGSLPWLAAALPLEILALNLYLDAIRVGALVQTLPFLALTPVASVGAAYFLLGERVAPMGAVGILLVGAGCYFAFRMDMAYLEETPAGRGDAGAGRGSRRRAMLQMAVVALIYSVTPVLAKGAMKQGDPFAFGIAYYSSVAALSTAVILVRNPRAWRGAIAMRAADWAIGICIAAVVLMHYAALQVAAVPYFLALKRMSIVFGAVIGTLALGQAVRRKNWLPSALVAAGAGLIVLR